MSILNRKARFQYHFLEYYVAGIQLFGTEVKSVRQNKVNIVDSFCQMQNGELYSIGMYIAEYKFGTNWNHSSRRQRKLLLNKKELKKINKKLKDTGLTIVPIELFFNDKGYVKMKIVLAKGKKTYDKRESLRKRDSLREIKQSLKIKDCI
ncbi:SsrA-binding protein [Blattabacterium sp. (Blattella germanica) str. Bge]|uniref:SsrA-binding protein SmpB n=1 Tax=Blattabacterium sp. (Blattella germanica) TaxID=624186 RepID=UPI0001BB61D1|nr:SsrA-binding protein SmpB [Blattabacterium sp. (Blattella germanica)]ACY40411.1 SsrA-binding protein [Blattabacterium sp. (Blattella germanica) str. Bge]